MMQIEIEKNERLHLKRISSNNKIELKVNLYVCNVGLYWDYLESLIITCDETRTVLSEMPDYETNTKRSCIIIECGLFEQDNYINEESEAEEQPLPKRKFRVL